MAGAGAGLALEVVGLVGWGWGGVAGLGWAAGFCAWNLVLG